MSLFERLALRGLWIIIRLILKTQSYNSGTEEVMWAKDVSEALDDPRLKNL